MKRISIIQPSFLPWLGYFEQMSRADIFVHFDDVQYTRKDWRNRNRLKSPNGVQTVTVPVQKHIYGQSLIKDIRISNTTPWNEKLIQQLSFWYKHAAFFDTIFPQLEAILLKPFEFLVDLNSALNDLLRKELKITTPQFKSSDIPNKPEDRNLKIIEICKHHQADLLYDGHAAQNFIDIELFQKNEIKVVFQDYQHKPYRQLWGNFVSHLSALDLLMNCGPDSRDIMLSSPIHRGLSDAR